MTAADQVKNIVDRIHLQALNCYLLDGKEKYVYNHRPYFNATIAPSDFGRNDGHTEYEEEQNVIQNITNTIYAQFYCGIPEDSVTKPKVNIKLSDENFIKELSKSNMSRDGYDYSWKVYSQDTNGTPWAVKNGNSKAASPGTFVNADPKKGSTAQVNDIIHFIRKKEDTQTQPAFYYVYGDHTLQHETSLTRFYFNTTPEGSKKLIEKITSILNFYQIPFAFKCLNNPENYKRNDSAVLYLNKVNTPLATVLISSFIEELRPILKKDIPMFALKVWDGVGFAEDPGDGDSFGMNRSRLIAQALVKSYKKEDKDVLNRYETVKEHIMEAGYKLDDFHLNPFTHFHYNFPKN